MRNWYYVKYECVVNEQRSVLYDYVPQHDLSKMILTGCVLRVRRCSDVEMKEIEATYTYQMRMATFWHNI